MKYLILIFSLFSVFSCSEKQEEEVKIPINQWYPLERTIDEYQALTPERPLLVHFICDWNLTSLLTQKHIDSPRFYKLLTDHGVLPLTADYSDPKGVGNQEAEKVGLTAYCAFLLITPSGEHVKIILNKYEPDDLYQVLKSNLESHLQK